MGVGAAHFGEKAQRGDKAEQKKQMNQRAPYKTAFGSQNSSLPWDSSLFVGECSGDFEYKASLDSRARDYLLISRSFVVVCSCNLVVSFFNERPSTNEHERRRKHTNGLNFRPLHRWAR